MRFLLLIVFIVSACGTEDLPIIGSDCDTNAVAENLEDIAERWDDAMDVAGSSSRIALAGPVSELQSIRRETRTQDWPECGQEAQQELVGWMDESINALIAFMGQDDDATVEEHLKNARVHQENFFDALEDLRK